MEKYTNYCTKEQIIRAYKLGAPIDYCLRHIGINKPKNTIDIGLYSDDKQYSKFLFIPTTQQMIGWLREKGFFFKRNKGDITLTCEIIYINVFYKADCVGCANNKQEDIAELVAIDAALDYLEKGETK